MNSEHIEELLRAVRARARTLLTAAAGAADKAKTDGKKLWKKGCAAAEKGWEAASAATADAWDRAGRAAVKAKAAVARHPVSPMLYVTLLSVVIAVAAFQGTYTSAESLEDPQPPETFQPAEYQVMVMGLPHEEPGNYAVSLMSLTDDEEPEKPEKPGPSVQAYALNVDGEKLGYAATKEELYQLLDEVVQPYLMEDAVSYAFVEDVEVEPVELSSGDQINVDALRALLNTVEVEDAYYEVVKGDTFNAIAYSLGMTPNALSVLNPEIEVNKLWVGQKLLIQQRVPYLSVVCYTDEVYEEVIESPVEYVQTADLYVGNTSVKEQGEDGLALIDARVTYINGVESQREILSSETLEEATTTVMYTGTTPRPATASNGYYVWPVRGTITSYFGSRWIGYSDYHLGLDIACAYGTTVKAADGGKVTFAGWRGSYGYLVIITHDNGQQTYYAHNSSLLVSAGQRVYQGQAIAKVGATGNASGPHCHFEIRINGAVVNPLRYLSK